MKKVERLIEVLNANPQGCNQYGCKRGAGKNAGTGQAGYTAAASKADNVSQSARQLSEAFAKGTSAGLTHAKVAKAHRAAMLAHHTAGDSSGDALVREKHYAIAKQHERNAVAHENRAGKKYGA